MTDRIVHGLAQIIPGKPVRVELPLRTTGTAAGVIGGGRLRMLFRRVPVRGLADDLPEDIVIDVTPLEIGDNKRVSDIEVPNCTVLLNDSTLLVAVKRTRAAMSAESGEEGDEGGDAAEAPAEAVSGEGGDAQQLNNCVSPAETQPKTDEVLIVGRAIQEVNMRTPDTTSGSRWWTPSLGTARPRLRSHGTARCPPSDKGRTLVLLKPSRS